MRDAAADLQWKKRLERHERRALEAADTRELLRRRARLELQELGDARWRRHHLLALRAQLDVEPKHREALERAGEPAVRALTRRLREPGAEPRAARERA